MKHFQTTWGYGSLTSSLAIALVLSFMWGQPSLAQPTLQRILRNTSQSQLKFSPYTVGSIISGATNRVYILNAQKGQRLQVTVNSTGARAFVSIWDSTGKELATLTDRSQPFDYDLPRSGDYYIFCHGGPTYHFYDLTVRVD